MRLRFGALGAMAVLFGCGQPPPPSKGDLVVQLSAPPAASEATAPPSSSASEPAGPALPAPLRGPRKVACTLETEHLFDRHNWRLRLRPGGEEAILANGGVIATLQLPEGDALDGAYLALRDPRASIAGWLNGADVRLSAARAIVVAGFLVPYPWTGLTLQGSSSAPARVRVGLAPDPAVDYEIPAVQEVGCDALTIGEAGSFESLAALPVPVGQRYGKLTAAAVGLAREPAGATVAVIHAKGERVWVHRSEAGKTLITYPSAAALVFGWIDDAHVVASTDPASRPGTATSWATGGGRSLPFASHLRCSDALPVVLELGGERASLGHFAAGEIIQVSRGRPSRGAPVAPSGPFRAVRLKGRRFFTVADGAELLAPTGDVAKCQATGD